MTDTPNTKTAIQGSFADNTTSAITPQRLRNGFETLFVRTDRSVLEFGAVGDGQSHPLSSRYASLAAAQVDFPHASALTDEIDWCATQAAINACAAAGGGTVYSPAGGYVCNRTLTFPVASTEYGGFGTTVNWRGDGMGATRCYWNTDLGSGIFAVLCANRANQSSSGFFSNIGLYGPGVGSTYGSALHQMQGLGWGPRRTMYKVYISGFWSGLNIVGDQTHFDSVVCQNNYYGIYFDVPSPSLFGDLHFTKCIITDSLRAAVGVNGSSRITSTSWQTCIFATSPYAIWKEVGGTDGVIMINSSFRDCQFENIGNGMIAEANATPSSGIERCTFDGAFFLWNSTWNIAAEPKRAVIDVGYLYMVDIIHVKIPQNWREGTIAVFNLNNYWTGVVIEGELDTWLGVVPAAKFFAGSWGGFVDKVLLIAPAWKGRAAQASATVTANQLLEVPSGGGVQPSTGTAAVPIAGVCRFGGASGQFVVYATEGVDVTISTSGTLASNNAYIKASSSGQVVNATGPTDGTVVGYCTSTSNGSCGARLRCWAP